MLYSEKMPIFTAKYPAQTITVDGAAYCYVRSGAGRDKTLVLLNGGMRPNYSSFPSNIALVRVSPS